MDRNFLPNSIRTFKIVLITFAIIAYHWTSVQKMKLNTFVEIHLFDMTV